MSMENPVERYLRNDRMPHIWCPSCGIGVTVNCFARALDESGLDLEQLAIVSGIDYSRKYLPPLLAKETSEKTDAGPESGPPQVR